MNLLHITAARAKVLDLTFPLTFWYSRATVRRGNPEVLPWSFVRPLRPEVWLTILIALLCVVALMTELMIYLPGQTGFYTLFMTNTEACTRVLLQQGKTC